MMMNLRPHKTILKNGIRIITKNMLNVRSVCIGIWVETGARDESFKQNGVSHFIEHILFKGTKKRNASQIAKEFDSIGGQNNAFTTMENTCYYVKAMDFHLDKMIDIISDIFLNSLFNEKEIENEREVILQEIAMVEDSPEDYIYVLLNNDFFPEHPLGQSVIGTKKNIENFDLKILKDFFHNYYQPDKILISASGNIEHNKFVDIIAPIFDGLSPPKNNKSNRIPPKIAKPAININYKKLEQLHVCLAMQGVPITDPRKYALLIMNSILGGSMSSRLFQELREKNGLAYSVYSFISSFIDTGLLGIYIGIDKKNIKKSLNIIITELVKIKQNEIDSKELQNAKDFIKGNLYLSQESTESQMEKIAKNDIYFGKDITIEEIIDKVESVTSEEINTLAYKLFEKGPLTLTTLGPISEKDKASFQDYAKYF